MYICIYIYIYMKSLNHPAPLRPRQDPSLPKRPSVPADLSKTVMNINTDMMYRMLIS